MKIAVVTSLLAKGDMEINSCQDLGIKNLI
jgi:hypothetical protein